MKIYFLSSRPCALRLGGVYFGSVDTFERFAQITLSDHVFVEFIPENALPVTFFLTEEILHASPYGCETYLLRDAIAIYARDFPPVDHTLRPIAQLREQNLLFTLFSQGEVHLSIQTEENFFIATLPPAFCRAELSFVSGLLFVKSPEMLAVFNPSGERLFLEKVLSYSVENDVLSARIPLAENLGRVADCTYSLSQTACTRVSFTLLQSQTERREELFAFAFFESVFIGADFEEFLSDALRAKAADIRAFLGEFTCVIPTETENCCALFYPKAENLFEARYFTLSVENGEIIDITT